MCRLARVLAALIVLTAAACGAQGAPPPSLAVGSAPDPESVLIANIYASALRFYGTPAHVQTSDDPLSQLDSGDVRVVAGLTGRLLRRFEPAATAGAAAQVYREMVSALPEGVGAGDYTESAEDKPALAVPASVAAAWGWPGSFAALRNCDKLRVVGVDGAARPDAVGPCKPTVTGSPDSAAMFSAVEHGRFNAAWTSTAAPDIPAELVMLSDRTALIRAENLVPLYRRNELNEAQVLALNEVAGVLDTAGLAEMRAAVAKGADPGHVSGAFIVEHPLGD